MNVLIVEDDENSRILLESSLTANGYQVKSAENGKIALDLAIRNPPDLIISDILMPEMDGYTLCKELKSNTDLRHIPFIFYTATYTDPSDEKLAMDLGASRFIVKPLDMDTFLNEIAVVLKTKKTEKPSFDEHRKKTEQELENNHAAILNKKLNKKVQQLEEEKKKLLDSEKKYRRLVEVLRDDYFFYTYNTNGIMTYISPSISNVLGYTQEHFKIHFFDYLTKSAFDQVIVNCNKCINGLKHPPYELEILHKSGNIHQLEITEEPVIDNYGRVIGVEGIAHDITKRISAEKQLSKAREQLIHSQKMEAIGTLAGGIAHDFNNILSSIMGFTELALCSVEKKSPLERYMNEIYTAGNRAKELVGQILAFARRSDEEIVPVKVSFIAKEVVKFMRSSTPTTIKIKQTINSNDFIMGNATQIHRLLMNLCINAVQAMEDKGGTLELRLDSITGDRTVDDMPAAIHPGGYLQIKVMDTGTGIPRHIINSIFEPYFTTKEQSEGTGMGLAVVHGVVESYGGQITVESALDQGTVFTILFPVTQFAGDNRKDQYEHLPSGNERILFVDDEDGITTSNSLILRQLGYKVTSKNSSTEALSLFGSTPDNYDLVITDMTMPGMTGDVLAKEILSIRPDMPIILCTGYSKKISVDAAKKIGIKALARKPLVKKELADTVRMVLDQSVEQS